MSRLTPHRPILIGASVYAVLMVVYQLVLTPLFPEEYMRHDARVDTTVRIPGSPRVFHCIHDAERASVLVAGDSRVQRGLVLDELERGGLPRTAIVWGRGAKTLDLLELVRRYPSRRLVVALSTIGLYFQRAALTPEPELSFTESVDDWLRVRARAFQRGHVRMLDTTSWAWRWFEEREPGANDKRYKRFMAPETRVLRDEQLARLEAGLQALLTDGWDVVCVRMPIAPSLLAVEDEGFPRERFRAMCERLGIPFLDHVEEPYESYDGSHLTKREAARYSAFLGRELARVSGWQ